MSIELCGFVPMSGPDRESTTTIDVGGLVQVSWDPDQPIVPAALAGVLDRPSTSVWSGVMVSGDEPFDAIALRLTGADPATCLLTVPAAARDAGVRVPAMLWHNLALVEGDSLAYWVMRRAPGPEQDRWELGAIGHGPARGDLTDRIIAAMRAWDRDRTAEPTISAYPAGTPDGQLPEWTVIDKPHTRLVITHPTPETTP